MEKRGKSVLYKDLGKRPTYNYSFYTVKLRFRSLINMAITLEHVPNLLDMFQLPCARQILAYLANTSISKVRGATPLSSC